MSKYKTRIRREVTVRPSKVEVTKYYVEYKHKYWPFWIKYDDCNTEKYALDTYIALCDQFDKKAKPLSVTSSLIKSD